MSFFTSGSEGKSKLVSKVGRQFGAQISAATQMLGIPPSCRVLCLVPLYHILGFMYGFLVPLSARGQVYLLADSLPGMIREALLSYRPNLVVATALQYRFLASAILPGDGLPEAVYLSSGAPLLPRDRDAFREKTGRSITELYGSTETGGIAWRVGDSPWTPYPGVTFRIDGDRLWVRSPWAHPDETESFVETQDAAEPVGDGFRLLGRASAIVKVGGKRLSSLEVERILRSHPAVEDAAVVPIDQERGDGLAAFVVVAPEAGVGAGELRSYLAARMASFKVPRTLRILQELPRRRLGKLDYASLTMLARGDRKAKE